MSMRTWFRYLFRREDLTHQLEEELAFHIEMRARREMETGKSQPEAMSRAHTRFGNSTAVREQTRDSWRFTAFETGWRDLVRSFRNLLRTPVFTGVAVISLALGIGANAAIFSLIDKLLLQRLPIEEPERLVAFDYLAPYLTYEWLRDHSPAFEGVTAVARISGVHEANNVQGALEGRLVSGNYFDVLKVRPFLGRTILPEDDARGAPNRVVVLSYSFWRARFQGDSNVIGRTIALRSGWLSGPQGTAGFHNGAPDKGSAANFTIIGVAAKDFNGEEVGHYTEFWVPIGMQEHFMPGRHWLSRDTARWVQLIGRLKPGVSIRSAETVENITLQQFLLAREGHNVTESRRKELQRERIRLVEGSRGLSFRTDQFSKPLWVLQGMIVVVLLLACTNLVNLQMTRSEAKRREIATRLALGAGTLRLLRQLMIESGLLAFAGAVAAIPLASYGGKFLYNMAINGDLGTELDFAPNGHVLLFTAVLGLLTVLIFGFMPALCALNRDMNAALKENRVAQNNRRSPIASRSLIAIQVAMATVLLVCTGLFTRTLFNLKLQDVGYTPDRLIVMRIDPTSGGYTGESVGQVSVRLLNAIRALPGVERATFSENGLFGGLDSGTSVSVKGFVPATRQDAKSNFDQIGPDYFATVGIPLLMGREFALTDSAHRPRVAIINQAFAHRFFGSRNPVGETVAESLNTTTLTVVGVVANVRDSLHREVRPRFYVPLLQPVDELTTVNYEVRSKLAAAIVEKQLRNAVSHVDINIPILSVEPVTLLMDNTIATERIVATLSIWFGLLALMLAVIGLYGVMAYNVARRTQEIGVRMALGARYTAVIWLVLRDSLALVMLGTIIGLPSALLLSRYLDSLLFGLKSNDIATYATVSALLAAVGFLAALLPARRASRIDLLTALRCE